MAPCLKNVQFGDFPSGPGVKNLPCNAGDMASIPDQGTKNPPAAEQLSQGATTRESTTRRTSRAATKTQHSPINFFLMYNFPGDLMYTCREGKR